jgi:DNA-binding XRE family transcriptional regulator
MLGIVCDRKAYALLTWLYTKYYNESSKYPIIKEMIAAITNRIQFHRERVGMSREKLATLIGKSYASVTAYEQGVRDPDSNVWIKLAELFDVSVDELMGISGRRAPVDPSFEERWPEVIQALIAVNKIPTPEERKIIAKIIRAISE